jgi:hypothetical protein
MNILKSTGESIGLARMQSVEHPFRWRAFTTVTAPEPGVALGVLLQAGGQRMNLFEESEAIASLDSKCNFELLQARSASCQETNPSLAVGPSPGRPMNCYCRRYISGSLAENLPESDQSLKKLGYKREVR